MIVVVAAVTANVSGALEVQAEGPLLHPSDTEEAPSYSRDVIYHICRASELDIVEVLCRPRFR